MNQPYSIFSPVFNPIENKANWLGRYLSVEKSFSTKLAKVLSEAATNIDDYFGTLVDDNVSTKVARVRISLAHKEIRRQMREIFGTTKHLIKDHQQDAAVAAVNAALYDERGVLSWLFPDSINRVQYADSLKQTAKRNIESTITRVLFTEKPLSERVYKTEALANGIVSRTVNNALARGDSAKNLAKDVRALIDPEVPGGVSYAAMRLGRTEINNAFHAQSIMDSQEKPWVEEMRWHLSKRHEKDPGDECETYSLQGTFKKENVPEKPHPNCFSGETLITAQSVRSVSKRWYEGSFIDVFCAEDSPQLSGTPNHPALTKRGWVPLSELREGDYLAVNPLRHNTSGLSIPNHDYVETRIEDIFKSFSMSVGVTTITVPSSPEQFHGDGIIGENVDIVLTDSLLQNGWDSKGFSQGAFLNSGMALLNFFGFSPSGQIDIGSLHSSNSIMRGFASGVTPFGAESSMSLSVSPEREIVSFEHFSQLSDSPSGNFTSLLGSSSCTIDFVRVERVLKRPHGFRGHVYNLSTESGWYTVDHNTDKVMVSNCRCFVTPELPSYDQFENALISGQYDPYLNSVMGEDYSSSREMVRRYSPRVQAKIDKEGHKKGDLWPDSNFTYDEKRELQEYNNAKRRNQELKKLEALEKNALPIKDSKIPESISLAENPKQVVNWLKDNYSGLEMVGFDDARVDIRMAQEIAEGFVKVQEKYPDNNLIRLKIGEIQDDQGNFDTVVAETRKVVSSKGNNSEIVFNQYFMDKYEELKSLKQGEAKTGFHTKGSGDRPWYSNLIHEFGHVLDYSGNYSTGRSLNPFKLGLKLDETPSATLSLIEYYENLLEIKNGVQTIVDVSDEAQLQGYWDWVLNYAPSTYGIITKNNRRFVFGDEYVAEAFIAMETLEKTTGPTKAVFKILMESLAVAKKNKSILVKIKKKKKK